MRLRLPAALPGLALLALGIGLARPSAAATFDEATGKLHLDADAALAISFDDAASVPADFEATFFHAVGGEQEVDYVANPDGLEGQGALSFGGTAVEGRFDLSSLGEELGGRRVELTVWQQPQGTRAQILIEWKVPDPGGDPEAGVVIGAITLLPTGRATDDGWIEFGSGPFDFAAAGTMGPQRLVLRDVQHIGDELIAYATPDATARVLLDALEIRDLGPALVPTGPCTAFDEATDCGPEGLCALGRCVDGAIVGGPVPQNESIRNDYLTRRLNEFKFYQGGRIPQANMPEFEAVVDGLRDSPTAATFWAEIERGSEKLWDGHTSPPSLRYGPLQSVNLGVCLHLGEADLLPGGGSAPLVFNLTSQNPFAAALQEGDVLVAIDGQPPMQWAAQVHRHIRYNGDPAGYEMVAMRYLLRGATQTGATLTFHRCPYVGPGTPTSCTANEVEIITLDLGAMLGQPAWSQTLPDWYTDDVECDFRFRRAVNDSNVREYDYAGFADEGQVRTLIINGVPPYYGSEGWWQTVYDALEIPPTHFILDQRKGRGGVINAVDFLMALMSEPQDFSHMRIVPWLDRELDSSLWTSLTTCSSPWWLPDQCGGYLQWVFGEEANSSVDLWVAGTMPVAVLNTFDVSGNDFTSKLATYRSGPTRIFAPAPTYGAFGPINRLPIHFDEPRGGTVQVFDTVFMKASQDPIGDFETSKGVAPDQVVLQKQSDAVQGIDTLIEAAKQWLATQ
ncbi:MAG: hypothetical protein JRI68_14530 [Deltaproteobacteria bacterium]|nr:hypothetical protein [Deltaproteobacteria bacterium]